MDDYANVLHGLVTLLSHRWRETDAAFAVALADAAMALFYDVENGGFYFTAANQPDLIFNPKPSFDEALPPGNATSPTPCCTWDKCLGTTYLDATNTLRWARAAMERYPANHCSFISALQSSVAQDQTVILRGPEIEMQYWRQTLCQGYQPWLHIYCLPYDLRGPVPNYLPGLVSAATRSQSAPLSLRTDAPARRSMTLEELRQVLGGG